MSDIVLSASVRQNLLSLQSTADLLATTQNRLATGKKVNTALDNPTNYFTAQSLDNRAGDINNLLDGIGNGVQVLQAANTGITSLQKLVDTAKSIANQALQATTGYSTKSQFVGAAITGATAANLLGTSALGTNASAAGTTALGTIDTSGTDATQAVATGATALGAIDLSGTTPPAHAVAQGNLDVSGGIDATGGDITFTINGTDVTLDQLGNTEGTNGDGKYTADEVAQKINDAGAGVNATIDDNGFLVLTSTGTAGASDKITTSGLGTAFGITDDASGTTYVGDDGGDPLDDLTFNINDKTVTLTTGQNYSAADIRDAINAQVGSGASSGNEANVVASLDANGKLVITSTDTANAGADDEVKIDTFSSGDATQLGFADAAPDKNGSDGTSAADLTFNVNGQQVKLDAGGSYNASQIVDAINTQVGTSAKVKASLDGSGNLVVTSTDTASADDEVKIDTFSSGDATQLGFADPAPDAKNGSDPAASPINGLELKIDAVGGGQAIDITFGTDSANGQVSTLDQLNTALSKNNLEASISSDGKITITTTNDYASYNIGAISGSAVTTTGAVFKSSTVATSIKDTDALNARASLVAQYNTVIDQIKTTAQDASFNGVNLLNGDQLKLVFNETGKSQLTISGVTDDPAGLGLSSLTSGVNFLDNSDTNKILATLNDASTTLRSQASTLGSNLSIVQIRQDFNKNLINVLQTGSSNLTLADTNEEAANSQALSTRQSIAVSALALANQSQQSVLQLLR